MACIKQIGHTLPVKETTYNLETEREKERENSLDPYV